MNNIYMRKIDVTADYQSLAEERIVLTVTISVPPTNTGNVFFKADDDSDVPWVPGEWHDLYRVDLAEIQVKGTPGDVVTVVGGSW